MSTGELVLPRMDGLEITPGVVIVGEPAPVPGTDRLVALASVGGCLCTIELRLRFELAPTNKKPR